MPNTVIRPAEQADLAGVLVLYRYLNPADPPLDPAQADAAWRALLCTGCNTVFVAEVAGTLTACCTLSVIPNLTRGARFYGVIENVVTDPAHRRQGLGHAVLHAALAHAWGAGCYKVMLASARREETLRFYDAAGFTRGGKTAFEARNPDWIAPVALK